MDSALAVHEIGEIWILAQFKMDFKGIHKIEILLKVTKILNYTL